MKPAPFSYFGPGSLNEALGLLETHGDEAKALAGGQSLVPLMNFRLVRPRYLVDLNRVEGLGGITVADGKLTLGAMVRQREVELSPSILGHLPILHEAIRLVGHPAIRNRGTVGGSLVHADPAAELPVLSIALDAEFQILSARKSRSVKAAEFFQGYLTTALASDELLSRIDLPLPPRGTGWCFTELARRHGDFAIVAVAALLGLDKDRKVNFARIALGGVGPSPVRAPEAEQSLLGERLSVALYRKAGEAAAQALDPPTDIHASSGYRRHVAAVLIRRALVVAETRVKDQA